EAEREYVTRGGSMTAFWWGPDPSQDLANYQAEGEAATIKGTVAAQSFKPNAFGLFQVHGNVGDWVEDCWNPNYQGAPTDGSAWLSGDCTNRVGRGGGWFNSARDMRAAARWKLPQSVGFSFYGAIRLARDIAQ